MLDSRVYRAAFVPVVFALLIAAFALGERPRPIGTTLAPDAFDGARAFSTLAELARTFPRTRPGSAGDAALATRIEGRLRSAGFAVRTRSPEGDTIDGDQALRTVIGEREGLSQRRIVILTQRDRAAEGDRARLSGTAAMLELASLYTGRPTRRTLTFVSTSGGSGGLAGVRDVVDHLGGPVDAVLVVGDIASRTARRPFVIPWSEHGGFAPLRLRRTVENALRMETDLDPGSPRALAQWARLAVPLTLTPQGVLGAHGLAAVTVQVSGERGPAPGADVSRSRLESFGRGVLRSISALDNGPDLPRGPREYVLFQGRLLPTWAVSVIAGLLLLPALIGAVDGLARVRRRRQPVAMWLRWLAACAAPFLAGAIVARLLGAVGVLSALHGPVDPMALPAQTTAVILVALAVVLGLALAVPLARRLGAPAVPGRDHLPGAAAAVALSTVLLALCVWAVNPYTALLLAPAVHLWLLAVVPEVRLPRPLLVAGVLLGFLPFVLVALYYARQFGLSGGELLSEAVVVLGGGTVGPLGALVFSGLLGCGLGAVVVAVRKVRRPAVDDPDAPVRIRGPVTYAGPGSLGGTESALRR